MRGGTPLTELSRHMRGERVLTALSGALTVVLLGSACAPQQTKATENPSTTASMPCPITDSVPLAGAITSPRSTAGLAAPRSSLIPNGDFADGLRGWLISNPAIARLEPSERDAGEKLRVVAEPSTKLLFINSSRFPVTAGATYQVTVGAGLGPTTTASGAFSLVFLSTREVGRDVGRIDQASGAAQYGEIGRAACK